MTVKVKKKLCMIIIEENWERNAKSEEEGRREANKKEAIEKKNIDKILAWLFKLNYK